MKRRPSTVDRQMSSPKKQKLSNTRPSKKDVEKEHKPVSKESKFKKINNGEDPTNRKKPKFSKSKSDAEHEHKISEGKKSKFTKSNNKGDPTTLKEAKLKTFSTKHKGKPLQNGKKLEKVEDWTEFKKKKKELKLKRKQSKNSFDVIVKAKKIGEELRRKTLKGGEEKRTQLINELHSLLKGKDHYAKFVLAHDTARLVQWLLKYASPIVVQQISKELIPVTVEMLQSKYGVFCVKRLLKYGSSETRSQVIESMYGHAVKLASHSVSAPVVEYAFSTWASSVQKQNIIQEFFGDLYKNSKDVNIKHLRDTYKNNETLKAATLGATKANLMRILNKTLLDSGLVQSVLCQFLMECSDEDRSELISQLASHIVVISNSKDGARAAMQCIWHGTNKDRKVIMKTLKEHLVELSKHEHGHCTVIALLDSADDTVLLHKIILTELLKNAKELAVSEWGRKVLLWLVAPADSTKFHPVFINELKQGRESSTSKKSPEIRQKEILGYAVSTLLDLVADDASFWLSNASLATEMSAIVKAGRGDKLENVYNSIVEVITDLDWKIKEKENDMLGIEHPGLHMALKKLAQHDKTNLENGNPTFGKVLAGKLNDEMLTTWIGLNRACFVLVAVFENGSEETQNMLKNKLKKHIKKLESQKTSGAKILLKKLD